MDQEEFLSRLRHDLALTVQPEFISPFDTKADLEKLLEIVEKQQAALKDISLLADILCNEGPGAVQSYYGKCVLSDGIEFRGIPTTHESRMPVSREIRLRANRALQ